MKIIVGRDETGKAQTALFDEERLLERIAAGDSIVGNIYKGRILRRLTAIDALSVDIGEITPAFLPVDDANAYRQGDEIWVQAATDSRLNRGARLIEEISLPGLFITGLIGKTRFSVGVSKNITDDALRMRLKRLVRRSILPDMGAIVRTQALDATETDILLEIESLLKNVERIRRDFDFYSAPKRLLDAGQPEYAILRLFCAEVDELIFDSKAAMERTINLLPEAIKSRVNIAVKEVHMPPAPNHSTRTERIELASGGNIIIERTQALTVIDVNSGGGSFNDKSATVLNTNIEAAYEIARRLRVKNISGMIVIDFIDMPDDDKKAQVFHALTVGFSNDTARVKFMGFTNMGLFEMTRKSRH